MQLKINLPKGYMKIYLEEFLKTKSITKFRKLLKMIKTYSSDPETVALYDISESMKAEIDNRNKGFITDMIFEYIKQLIATESDYIQKLLIKQSELNSALRLQEYAYTFQLTDKEEIKECKREIRNVKATISRTKRKITESESNITFYKKCISIIERGDSNVQRK